MVGTEYTPSKKGVPDGGNRKYTPITEYTLYTEYTLFKMSNLNVLKQTERKVNDIKQRVFKEIVDL